jgi:hypothetical protein
MSRPLQSAGLIRLPSRGSYSGFALPGPQKRIGRPEVRPRGCRIRPAERASRIRRQTLSRSHASDEQQERGLWRHSRTPARAGEASPESPLLLPMQTETLVMAGESRGLGYQQASRQAIPLVLLCANRRGRRLR